MIVVKRQKTTRKHFTSLEMEAFARNLELSRKRGIPVRGKLIYHFARFMGSVRLFWNLWSTEKVSAKDGLSSSCMCFPTVDLKSYRVS